MNRPRRFWTIWSAALLACCVMVGTHLRAQVPLTGAGLGAPASGPPPFTPCAGTVITLSQPNNITVTPWGTDNSTPAANAATAPDSTNTASSDTATGANFLSGVHAGVINFSGSTTYSITGFAKPSVSPNWLFIGFTDFATYRTANYFNIGTGAVGSADSGVGDGTITCAKIAASTGGWFEYSLGVSFAGAHTGDNFILYFAGADLSPTSTTSQAFFSWGVGQ